MRVTNADYLRTDSLIPFMNGTLTLMKLSLSIALDLIHNSAYHYRWPDRFVKNQFVNSCIRTRKSTAKVTDTATHFSSDILMNYSTWLYGALVGGVSLTLLGVVVFLMAYFAVDPARWWLNTLNSNQPANSNDCCQELPQPFASCLQTVRANSGLIWIQCG